MIFRIDTNELSEAITKCNTIIDNKSSSPQLKEIHICIKDNNIQFRATNNIKDFVIYNCKCDSSDNIEFTLQNTKELVKAIKYFEIESEGCWTKTIFEIIDNNCTITCVDKKIKLKLFKDSYDKYPEPKELDRTDINEYNCNVTELLDLVDRTKYAIAKDHIRPLLEGICFDNNKIVTLDGYRLVKITQNIINVKRQFVIDTSIFDIVKKIFAKNDIITIKEDLKNISIQCNNTTIICQKLEGEFIKYENIINVNSAVVNMEVDVKDTIKQLKYLYDFTDIIYHRIVMFEDKLTVENNGLEVEAKIKTYINGKDNLFKIAFSCKYLLEALQNIGTDTAIIKLAKDNAPFYIESVGADYENLVVILPIR